MNETICPWAGKTEIERAYHDDEWGIPQRDQGILFEFLLLEGTQAGLSWLTILRKRENYRAAFDNFDPEKIALYDENKVMELLANEGIVRNKLKINSAIKNARAWLDLCEKDSGVVEFIWNFVEGKPIQNSYRTMAEIPATSPESATMATELKKLGFNFVGSTICYAFMQAIGMVNDHLISCPQHDKCTRLAHELK